MKNIKETELWLIQARADKESAAWNVKGKFYSQSCFLCQQSAEKYLKAYLFSTGQRVLITHSVRNLVKEASDHEEEFNELMKPARELDKLYQQTRYPDALPDVAPSELYTKEDAEEAIEHLEKISLFIEKKLA